MHEFSYVMGFWWFIPLIFFGLLFYMMNPKKEQTTSALDILNKRYAKGEIDEEEYKRKKALLKS